MAVNTIDGSIACSPIYRFQLTLSSPIVRRCYELAQIMEEVSVKDLQLLFPSLIKSVFGFNGQSGWGLRIILKNVQPQEFDTVRVFLAPDGPVMRAAYRLLADNYFKYEFPIFCLPTETQRLLQQGVIPAFYTSKLQPPAPGQSPTSIYLNAFEYYIFHLIYFLISPQNQKDSPKWANLAECVYPHIVEEFLRYFLPYYGGDVPPAPTHHNGSFEMSTGRSLYLYPQSRPWTFYPETFEMGSQIGSLKSLLGFKSPQNMAMYSSSPRQFSSGHSAVRDKRLSEAWRSETIAQVLMEVWLNHYRVDFTRSKQMKNDKSRSPLFNTSSHGSSMDHLSQDGLYTSQNCSFTFTEATVPSHDHVRMVRMLVKHIHYFANSAGEFGNTPLYDLKKAIIPHMMQKKLYGFLRHVFDHWPLDASFRTILETWLSYVQPWRYTDYGNANVSHDDDSTRRVEPKWQSFVEENLAFYTVIFQQILPNLFRMDLSSPKNAYMLLRVTKVFSQANLCNFIKKAEDTMQEPMGKLGSGVAGIPMRSPASPLLNESRRPTSARQHVSDLENTGFMYTPMFGEDTLVQVQHLLALVRQAKDYVVAALKAAKVYRSKGFLSGMFEWIQSLFETDDPELSNDERSPANMRKVEQHLDTAFTQLTAIFNVPPGFNLHSSFDQNSASMMSIGDCGSSFSSSNILNDVIKGVKRHDVSYQGDPDLQPIRSYEMAFLVRWFHQLSTFINNKYGLLIGQLFDRRDLVGRICRQYIQPPMVYHTYTKDSSTRSKHSHDLPPRISLRSLANQKVIAFIVTVILCAYMFYGVEPFVMLMCLLACAVMYPFLTAVFPNFR